MKNINFKEINVSELKEGLEANRYKLLDVREPFELDICSIPGSINIPMNKVYSSLDYFNDMTTYAVMCHSGVRSAEITRFLNSNNFSAVNVIGGINEWATSIDKRLKKY